MPEDDSTDQEKEDVLIEILTASGFHIVPLKTIVDALAEMESYLKDQAGISQEELEAYLEKIEHLVGKEEALKLELDEILSWIRAFQTS